MADLPPARVRERSPPFPYIGLSKAIERTQQLYTKAKRHEVFMTDAASDWDFQPKSSSVPQTVGALLAFGLIEDSGNNDTRKIRVSELGWRLIEDNRPGVRELLLHEASMKPKLIAEMAQAWADGRPDDAHAKSQLKVEKGFTDEAATKFLRVFDDSMGYAKSAVPDKVATDEPAGSADIGEAGRTSPHANTPGREEPPAQSNKVALMAGERELVTGLLSKGASFRVVVNGSIGVKEIERLIRKLELDKEILADVDGEDDLVG